MSKNITMSDNYIDLNIIKSIEGAIQLIITMITIVDIPMAIIFLAVLSSDTVNWETAPFLLGGSALLAIIITILGLSIIWVLCNVTLRLKILMGD